MRNKKELQLVRSFLMLSVGLSSLCLPALATTLTESFDSSGNYSYDSSKIAPPDGSVRLRGGTTLVKQDDTQDEFNFGKYYNNASYSGGKVSPASAAKVSDVDRGVPDYTAYWDFEGTDQYVKDRKSAYNGQRGLNANAAGDDYDPTIYTSEAKGGSRSLGFDGIDDYVFISNSTGFPSLQMQNNVTISAWIKITSLSGDHATQTIFAESGSSKRVILRINSGYVEVWALDSEVVAKTRYAELATQTWYHIVYSRDGSDSKHAIYINGVKQALSINTDTPFESSDTNKYIGIKEGGQDPFFGIMDEVSVFTRTLNESEIKSLYHFSGSYVSTSTDGKAGSSTRWTKFLSTQSANFGKPLEKPPVVYLKMDEGSGNTAADALPNSSLNGTITDATWADTIPSVAFSDLKSLSFNGTSSFVSVPHHTSLNPLNSKTLSLSVWVNTSTGGRVLLSKGLAGSSGYTLKMDPSGFPVFVKEGVAGSALPGKKAINDSVWHHVGVVTSSTGMYLYIDGELNVSNTNATDYVAQANALTLGKSSDDFYFSGLMDEFSAFDRALSVSEMAALGSGRKRPNAPTDNYEKNLVALYRFDNDGSDSAGSAHGTFVTDNKTDIAFGEGVLGPAVYFSGDDQTLKIDSASFPSLANSFTFSLWFNPMHTTSVQYLFSNNSSSLRCSINDDGAVKIQKGSDVKAKTAKNVVKANQWNHLVYITNGSTNTLYLNGVIQTLDPNENPGFSNNNSNTKFFGGKDGDSRNFHGFMDEAAFFNAVLTDAQVADLYNRGAAKVKFQVRTAASTSPFTTIPWHGSGGGAPDKGVVGVWHFNEKNGQTVVDSGPHAFNGILGTSISGSGDDDPDTDKPCKIGHCYIFDGNNDYVNVPHQTALNPSANVWSMSAWIKTTKYGGGIVSKGVAGASGYDLSLNSSGKLVFKKTTADSLTGSRTLNDNNWHHVAAVASTTGMYLFVDGILDAANNNTSHFVSSLTSSLTMGKSDSAFEGNIDDVALYNRALSGTEVWELYRSGYYMTLLEGEYLHGLNQDQWLQYQAFFWTSDSLASSDIQAVNIYTGNYPSSNPTITTNAYVTFNYLTRFAETASKPNGTDIKYVLSGNEGSTWYYVNGSSGWTVSDGTSYTKASTAAEINTNLAGFDEATAPTAAGRLKFKAFLNSDGRETPALDKVEVDYYTSSVTLSAPNGNESYKIGDIQNITWSVSGVAQNDLVLEYALDGLTYQTIATGISAAGSYSWTVPNNPSSSVKVRIRSVLVPSIKDVSDNYFTIFNLAGALGQIGSSIGLSTDITAATLFGKLASIAGQVSDVKNGITATDDKVNIIKKNTGDIDNRTQQIKDKVDPIANDLTSIKSAVGADQTKTLYSKVGEIVTTIGSSSDPSSTASVFGKMREAKESHNANIGSVQSDVNLVKGDVSLVRGDVSLVRGDISNLKGDVANVKADVAVVRSDVGLVKGDVGSVKTEIGSLKGDISNVKGDVATVKSDTAKLLNEVGTGELQTLYAKGREIKWGDIQRIIDDTGKVYDMTKTIEGQTRQIDWTKVTAIETAVGKIDWKDIDDLVVATHKASEDFAGLKSDVAQVQGTADSIKNTASEINNNTAKLISEVGTTGQLKALYAKGEQINWNDITSIRTNTGTIIDVAGNIKAKTDTINWSQVSAIETKANAIDGKTQWINWKDIDGLRFASDKASKDLSDIQDKVDSVQDTADQIKTHTTAVFNEIAAGRDMSSNIAAIREVANQIKWDDIAKLQRNIDIINGHTKEIAWSDVKEMNDRANEIKADLLAVQEKVAQGLTNEADIKTVVDKLNEDLTKTQEGVKGLVTQIGAGDSDLASALSSAALDAKNTYAQLLDIKDIMSGKSGQGPNSVTNRLEKIQGVMERMSESVYSLAGIGADGQPVPVQPGQDPPVNLQRVHADVAEVMSQVRNLAGQQNVSFQGVYDQVASAGQGVRDTQNMILQVQAAAQVTQEIITKQANAPVMTTWLETGEAPPPQVA